jgi:hypothetical protein
MSAIRFWHEFHNVVLKSNKLCIALVSTAGSNLSPLGSSRITCVKRTVRIAVRTVDNSWWWAQKMPERCRVLWRNKCWIYDASSWLFHTKEIWLMWNSNWGSNVAQFRCISFWWGWRFILYFLEHPVFSMPVDHETPNYCCPSPAFHSPPRPTGETHFTYTLSDCCRKWCFLVPSYRSFINGIL